MTDMNPQDAITRLDEIRREIGPECSIHVNLKTFVAFERQPLLADPDRKVWVAHIRPLGYQVGGDKAAFHFETVTLSEIVEQLPVKWAERKNGVTADRVRAMAFAMMALKDSGSEVTRATLALEGFPVAEVAALGARACEEANRLSARGPFCIEPMEAANGQ